MTGHALPYEPLGGDLHRHGDGPPHAHPHTGPHGHETEHHHEPGHSHGLVDRSIMRSRKGLQAVGISFAVLGLAALAQTVIFIASGSIALLADLIHNFGDAATAIPLGIAFLLRSERAERIAGLFVVAAIFISACVAGVEAVSRLIHPQTPTHLLALAGAGRDRLRRQLGRGSDPHPRRADARQPGADRRWQPCPRRRLRQPGGDCKRDRRRSGPAGCRPADRPWDHPRDPQDHLGELAHCSRASCPLTGENPATVSRGG